MSTNREDPPLWVQFLIAFWIIAILLATIKLVTLPQP